MTSSIFQIAFDVGKDEEIACKTYSGVVEAVASLGEVAIAKDMIENSSDVFTEDSRGAQFIVQIPDDNNSSKSRILKKKDIAKTSPMDCHPQEKPKDKTNNNNNNSKEKKAKRCGLKRRKVADAIEIEEEQVLVKQRRIVHRLEVRWHTVVKYQTRRLTLHSPAYPANNSFDDQCTVSADSPIVSADSSPMVCFGRENSQACHDTKVCKCEAGKVGKIGKIDKHDPPEEKPRKSRSRQRRRKKSAGAGNDVEMNEEETAITSNKNNNKPPGEKTKTRKHHQQERRQAPDAGGSELPQSERVVQGMSEEERKRIASGTAKILAGCMQNPPVTPRIGKIEDDNISEHWISAVEQAFELLSIGSR